MNTEPRVYGPHDESLVSASSLWVEDVLAGLIECEFRRPLLVRGKHGPEVKRIWVGPKAIAAGGNTFSHNDDGCSWRLPCRRCNGEGKVSFEGAQENQFTTKKEKDCFLCGRKGFHVLPSVDRVCAAILVMAMQTCHGREEFDRPGHEALHGFLRVQLQYFDQVFPGGADYPNDWEVQIWDFCFRLYRACYEDFSSDEIREEFPHIWALAEAAYDRYLQNRQTVLEFFGVVNLGVHVQEEISSESLDKFKKLIDAHDWTYEYSDDSQAWKRGDASADEIRRAYSALREEHKAEAYSYHEANKARLTGGGFIGVLEETFFASVE